MSDDRKIVDLVCPECKKTERTILDCHEPQQTALVELPCSGCLDSNESLSAEPVFKDQFGMRLV